MSGHAIASREQKKQRLDIQGLRMLAVISVVLDHVIGWPAGGFVGVDVFFVISGFLITGLLLREYDRSGRISMKDFYRRRIKRLMPAALLVLLFTVTAGAILFSRPRAAELAWDGLFAAIFGANWRFAATGTDYFQAGLLPSPLQHYWSLSVEEQFYLVWPLVIIALLWLANRFGVSERARGIALGAGILVMSAGSLIWASYETSTSPSIAYFSTFSRGWELGVGAAVAILLHFVTWRPNGVWAVAGAYMGIVGIVASWVLITPESAFPAPWALLPVLGTAAVIVAGSTRSPGYDRAVAPLTNRFSVYIGDISYSLYLWHFPVAIIGLSFLSAGTVTYSMIAFALSFALSALTYRFVENPARKSDWGAWLRRLRGVRIVAPAVVCALVVSAGVVTWISLSTERHEQSSDAVAPEDCVGAAALMNGCGDTGPGPFSPSIDTFSEDDGESYACWRYVEQDWRDCTTEWRFGGELSVAVVGDSHAAMYLSAIGDVAKRHGWDVDRYVGYGCQWLTGGHAKDCDEQMMQFQERATDASDPYDLIITSAARWTQYDEDVAPEYARTWREAIDIGTQVIVIEDAPTFTEDGYQCLNRVTFDGSSAACVVDLQDAADPVDPQLEAAEIAGADLLSTHDFFCDESGCPAVVGGVVVYRDTVGHVTDTYVGTLAPFFEERLLALIEDS